MDDDMQVTRAKLLGSLLLFTQTFYKIRTGREFKISIPVGRESHQITISRLFTRLFRLQAKNGLINVEPGSGKSELCKHFVAWALAHYPDSNFIYITHSYSLAEKHTYGIKEIIDLPAYQKLFGVSVATDSKAKGDFKTNQGGKVMAFGLQSAITGHDAGLPDLDRFSGAMIIDDAHNLSEIHSKNIRETVIRNYKETALHRIRGINVPIIFIGQRCHSEDLPKKIIDGIDGREWEKVILKSLDAAGNALYPSVHPREFLLNEKETNPYVYASQYQQDPQPEGGGIYKPEWFVLTDEDPNILCTFITCDSAETNKNYNDATVFSFFGLYKIKQREIETDMWGLHWIDCVEIRVEPKDLENEFMDFYSNCMRYPVRPTLAAIEFKSTGTTLASTIGSIPGIQVIEAVKKIINKNGESVRSQASKTTRFLEIQSQVASKLISLPRYGRHTHMCIEHCKSITANNTHAHDDIADTLYYGVKVGLIDKIVLNRGVKNNHEVDDIINDLAMDLLVKQNARSTLYGNR